MKTNYLFTAYTDWKPFNNVECRENEMLTPVVLTPDMFNTLKGLGLDTNNIRTWHFKYADKPIPVAFIPAEIGTEKLSKKLFNESVKEYLSGNEEVNDEISLDEIMEKLSNDDASGFDPTGSRIHEDMELLKIIIMELIDEVTEKKPKYGIILKMLYEGLEKGEVISLMNVSNSYGYEEIKKAQDLAKSLYKK